MINLSGKKFGKLTVVSFHHSERKKHSTLSFWKCRCDCGTHRIIVRRSLISGNTRSCGCIRKKGIYHRILYARFLSLKARCLMQNHVSYKYYGGKGIKCEWKNFKEFRNDMEESFIKHLLKYGEHNTTLDRMNNAKNYSQENCKWATRKEQNTNKGGVTLITINGITNSLAGWEKIFSVSHGTCKRKNYNFHEAFNLPSDKKISFVKKPWFVSK